LISQAVASALDQSHEDVEVVVWDNGSSDSTADLIREMKDPRVQLFRTEETVPLYEARNRAVEVCRGDFVAFLDADDWWRSDKLSRQLDLFDSTNDVVYSNFFVVNQINDRTKVYTKRRLPEGDVFSALLSRYRVGLLTTIVRRSVFDHFQFDPSLEIIGDFDFMMRLARASEFRCVQEPLAWRRVHSGSESERKKRRHLLELESWTEAGASSGLLMGSDLKRMQRMVHAKRAEVEIESGHWTSGLAELARARPLGRQAKVVQRLLTSRRSVRGSKKPVDR